MTALKPIVVLIKSNWDDSDDAILYLHISEYVYVFGKLLANSYTKRSFKSRPIQFYNVTCRRAVHNVDRPTSVVVSRIILGRARYLNHVLYHRMGTEVPKVEFYSTG